MASGTKLVMSFNDGEGITRKFTYNYIKPGLTTTNLKNLMNGMITNGSVFKYPPATKKSAKLVTTTETEIDVSDE